MSPKRTPDRTALPLAVLDQIDRICDRFEAAWKAGEPPRIEEVLGGLDVAAKRPRFAGRAEAASPATGLFKRHVEEQAHLVAEALAA